MTKQHAKKFEQYVAKQKIIKDLEDELDETNKIIKLAEYQKMPFWEKALMNFHKGIGLLIGILFILILLMAGFVG